MSDPQTIDIVLFSDTGVLGQYAADGRHSDLLAVLNHTLEQYEYTAQDVRGIAVVVGTGTFTSTRLAVTVANVFAFASRLPVIAITLQEVEQYQLLCDRLRSAVPGQLISATYSGMPRIGTVTT